MKDDYASLLRRQAEALLNQQETLNATTAATLSEVLEELHIHQIELQIQHDSLQEAYDELEEERAKYANLYNNMPVGYLHLDINGIVQEANKYSCQLLRTSYKTLRGKRLAEFISPEDQSRFHFHLHRVFTENVSQTDELHIRHPDDTVSYVQVISHRLKATSPQTCHIFIHDITESKRHTMAQGLQETALLLTSSLDVDAVLERMMQFVARIVPCDVAFISLWDEHKKTMEVSKTYSMGKQYNLQGVCIPLTSTLKMVFQSGEPYLMFHRENNDWLETIQERMGVSPIRSYVVCPLFIRNDSLGFLWVGSQEVKHFTAYHIQDLRTFARQASLAVNNARQYVQSQQLATINERQRIARELHDAVKQNLFSASLIANNLMENKSELSPELGQYIDYLQDSLQSALVEMRILLDELRPEHILDVPDEKMLRRLSKRLSAEGIKVNLKTSLDAPLPIHIKIIIYRVLQEAITNILAHAHAKQVRIQLCRTAEQIELIIEDDGKGFDMTKQVDGHGLTNMRERVTESQGDIDIQSHAARGTRIALSWRLAASV